jgi:tetrahydromethanopterin S-methyltransferase subunit G
MGYKTMNHLLEEIEKRLDKIISDLEKIDSKKLSKQIDDLEGIKTKILTHDIVRLSGQINWNLKKEKQ